MVSNSGKRQSQHEPVRCYLVPKRPVLAPLRPSYTFLVSMNRSNLGSLMTEIPPEPILDPHSFTYVIKISFHNVSLTIGQATGAILYYEFRWHLVYSFLL